MNKKFKLTTLYKRILADTLTPVNIYLKFRDEFSDCIMLESSDYHGQENSLSMICCQPLASIKVYNNTILTSLPDGRLTAKPIRSASEVLASLELFRRTFVADAAGAPNLPGAGLFGYMAYDALKFFDSVPVTARQALLPEIWYTLYQVVIIIDHFHNELTLTGNFVDGKTDAGLLDRIEKLIYRERSAVYPFRRVSSETATVTGPEFLAMTRKALQHCHRGDVFQLVLSRRFTTTFQGDEFNVYRALRSINPSPYLFYFDYGNFKLFGSSPEAQLRIQKDVATIFPIAGTFRRTGDDATDAELARRLAADAKENAEHIMLVDLARNDLSRYAEKVRVEVFKEIQYYSHVIHLVSKVSGVLSSKESAIQLAASTFPAGTLSGAPKHMAMKLIDAYEPVNRGFYGGAIGYIGFNGDYNHAIMIRTFMSKDNRLIYQAGAGIVAQSDPETELQEVNNKLFALRDAVQMAETISR
ncbi:MAG: anthranilate synthase component I family protein [Flammeovirgaceae bacterium]|nr:MAG: anthranilate synthase component I family protein [Flammeovirgaceae bacterium]